MALLLPPGGAPRTKTNACEKKLKFQVSKFKEVMGKSLKVVALVSGGKDSCYSMLQCVSAGHQIVALANLRPKDVSSKSRPSVQNYPFYDWIVKNSIDLNDKCTQCK